jgi:Flp pilus assembly protein TadG
MTMKRSMTNTNFGAAGARRGWRAGSSAVEFALVAPFIIVMLVGTVDYGYASFQRMAAQHGAQVGAERAALTGFNVDAISTAVQSASSAAQISATPAPVQSCGCASGTTFTAGTCGTACPDGTKSGTYVTVSAQVVYNTLLPYPGIPNQFTFTETAFVRIQ